MSNQEDFSTLLKLFIHLVQFKAGEKIAPRDTWLNDAQILSIKLFRHIVSMQSLTMVARVESNDLHLPDFIDHASVKVVTRAALETYLVFFFIYGNQQKELSIFRHHLWHLGGLMDRQKFRTSTDEIRQKKAMEKEILEQLTEEIILSPYLRNYTEKQRKKILKGDWRFGNTWADLSKQAGFHSKFFDDIYNYLCGYSHSSYQSAMQVGQAETLEAQYGLTKSMLDIGLVIMAHYAVTYSKLFESTGHILLSDLRLSETVKKWHLTSEVMAKIYDS